MAKGKRVSKRAMAKAKRAVAKKESKLRKKNMDTYFLRVKNLSTLTPTQGITVSNYIYQGFTLSTATGISDFTKNADFVLYQKLYDRFRINRMTVKMIPKANMLDITLGQANNITQVGDMVLHSVVDRDGIAPSSIATMSRYPSYRQQSVLKPFKRSYAVKYPRGQWLDCQNVPASGDRLQDIGLYGTITVYAENLPEPSGDVFNDPIYAVEVSYDIVFQGRTNGKLSAITDIVGNVIGVDVRGPEQIPTLAQSPKTNVRGYLQFDTRTVAGNTEVLIGPND